VRVFEFPGSKEWGRYQGHFESETMGTGYQQHILFKKNITNLINIQSTENISRE